MTPAINAVKKAKVAFTTLNYEHDVNAQSFGLEAAQKLQLDPRSVFKTLVTQCDTSLVVAIIPVKESLSFKKLAKLVNAKKAKMADPHIVTNKTGYIMGGVSPFGQKTKLTTIIASSALELNTMYVSAGKRGLEIGISPKSLNQLLDAQFADICT
ncbi:MAG: Cys-tRNA(Pro)/Cys-tRNA(Cys) deacylase YbaK [Glaciecola sp. HTCC2999]|jgi:Cys-tRNA(Pro)/Cys-tRNA(Cys) deacylase|nr:MAG: Cys-tRNA(Pro)/Cys-tRNA(Cys) deacylase YbaK [Glaciecola sp. HTCC2999]